MATSLLVLEGRKGRIEDKSERMRVMNAVTSSGGKVRHDSGGRLLLIDTLGNDEEILKKLPEGVRLLSAEEGAKESIADLDASESMFLDAVRTRISKEYRAKKEGQKPGETPEEIELFTQSCTPEE